MIKIALIVGSTRPQRFADVPARWIEQAAAARPDLRLETLDLRDYDLPFFQEPLTPLASGGAYTAPAVVQAREAMFDQLAWRGNTLKAGRGLLAQAA